MHVLSIAHDSITGGHLGVSKTKERILSNFYWKGIGKDVKEYCKSCDICQKTAKKGSVKKVPLQKVPVVDVPFKRVAIDIIGPIVPASESGHRYILTLVDYATRYPEAVPLKKIDTETVAEALVDLYSRVGIPEEVLSDQGSQFTSECMKEVSRLLGIKQLTSTPYHPMCNGLVERFNGTLKTMIKRLCNKQPKLWHRFINAALFAYREVPQESTGFSPFELLYGRSIRGPMHVLRQLWTQDIRDEEVKNSYQYVFELRQKLDDTLTLAQEELSKSQGRYKHYYDRGTRDRKFRICDLVLVLLLTKANKLLMQWKGPYEVTGRIGPCDYVVNMKGKKKTLHANLLKQYISRDMDQGKLAGNDISLAEIKENPKKCMAVSVGVLEDYECDEENGSAEVLPEIGAWLQKESHQDVAYGEHLSSQQRQQIVALVTDHKTIFTESPGGTTLSVHHIKLTSDVPVKSKPYPIPHALREALHDELLEMEQLGIIRKSNSPYASPVVIVKKKDGSNRICVDYRGLNKITIFDPVPVTSPNEIFYKTSEAKYFSKIDLSKGYWQIPVEPMDILKTAFVTPDGHYEFPRMPFGMMNSGATLVRATRQLLEGMKNVISYVDDLLVYTLFIIPTG